MRNPSRNPSKIKVRSSKKQAHHLAQKGPRLNYFLLPLLIIIWALIKIGKTTQTSLKIIPQFVILALARISLLGKMTARRKHAGRPRKKSLAYLFWLKARRKTKQVIPRRSRIKIALATVFVILVIYSLALAKITSILPSPRQLSATERPLTTQILDREGKLLYQIYEGRNRKLIPLDTLPVSLINATIAIEDKHFYSHPGVDPWGILRALKQDIASQGPTLQGGSTITQQLIKNILLTPDQTWSRKIKEALLAFWAERVYSKQEILQMYFNEAPYGGPAWGVEAASQMYFGKSANTLNLAESSFLAGLPAAPTEYSPFGAHPEKGKQRQEEVLRRMVEDNYITLTQSQEALNYQLSFKPPVTDIKAPHFVMYVRSLLAAKYGERTVSQGGLKVTTTLDLNIQNLAEKVVSDQINHLANLNVGNGAAMVTEANTGQILAMVGSQNYFDQNGGNFNVALALRQPGSSIKPVTYVTGFKQGFSPGTVLLDIPTTFPNPWGKAYSPVNYDGKFHGPVTIRTALGSSYNVPAVKMLALVGVPAMMETAKEMGITTFTDPKNYGLSLTLGGGAVKLVDMMAVYGTLASGGTKYESQAVLMVEDAFGNLLEDHRQDSGNRAISEEIAYLVTNILADKKARIPAFGPNSLLEIKDHTVAVKTGTSDDKRDNWCFGYTPKYIVGAWVGNNDNSPMNPSLSSGITGATPIWHDIMVGLLQNQPDLAFQRPPGVTEMVVDGYKDLGINGQISKPAVALRKTKQKDEVLGVEKEVITYSDSFSNYNPDKLKTTQ